LGVEKHETKSQAYGREEQVENLKSKNAISSPKVFIQSNFIAEK